MRVNINIVKEIEIPDIVISNITKLNDDTLTSILHEIRKQIQPRFKEKIGVRERLNQETQFCEYCERTFDNMKALKMHYSLSHDITYDLYLSAHRQETTRASFVYFYLENPRSERFSNQQILKLKFKKGDKNE